MGWRASLVGLACWATAGERGRRARSVQLRANLGRLVRLVFSFAFFLNFELDPKFKHTSDLKAK